MKRTALASAGPSSTLLATTCSYLLLLAVFVVSIAIRFWLLDKRWINPDEGSHLMDAVFILAGKIPEVDFSSKGLIYVHSLAGTLKLFGTSYVSGRLLPITCSMLTGVVVFVIAKELFDGKVALLSAVLYWMFPLELVQSAIVKTEPLAALLTCLSLYAAVRFSQRNQKAWLVLAGVLAAMVFYVRESALIIPLIVIGFLLMFRGGRVRQVATDTGYFLVGYSAVIFAVLAYYSRLMSPSDLFRSWLNPFGFLNWVLERLVSSGPLTSSILSSGYSSAYLNEAVYLHLFLLIGFGFSVVQFAYGLLVGSEQQHRTYIISHSLLYVWLFFLFIGYTFYFYFRGGFLQFYSREFLPPLVIIFSAWLRYSVPAVGRDGVLERRILVGILLSAILFVAQAHYRDFFGKGHHASLAVALITFFCFASAFGSSWRRLAFVSILSVVGFIALSREIPFKAYLSGTVPSLVMIGMVYVSTWALLGAKARPPLRDYGKFIGHSIVFACFFVSVTFAATVLDLSYASGWSPQSVEKIVAYLKAETGEHDELLSGGMIWELQAGRMPFQMISHPLAFEHGISEKMKNEIQLAAATRPPKVIILDGFTEKTYIQQVPALLELLDRYRFVTATGLPGLPVRVYRLNDHPVREKTYSRRVSTVDSQRRAGGGSAPASGIVYEDR